MAPAVDRPEPVTAKSLLRHRRLASRHPLDPSATEDALAAAVLPLVLPLVEGTRVASYASVASEPSTRALHRLLAGVPGVAVLLPVLLADGDLDWAVCDGDPVRSTRGLLQPAGPLLGPDAVADASLVVVPALAVDRHGRRLGRGGGSYDRALRRATGLTVALLHDGEDLDPVPAEPHDVAVGGYATPSGGLVLLD